MGNEPNDQQLNTALIRMDKIGDLVVSLNAGNHPLIEKKNTIWFISKGLGWILEHTSPKLSYVEIPTQFSWENFKGLVQTLKANQIDQAFVFQAPWFVGLALLMAKVRFRAGRLSQWHSFLFFNRGVRQKRSLADRHESQYNLDLISASLGEDKSYKVAPHSLERQESLRDLTPFGLNPKSYCVVHPGMMGSALNWPTEYYLWLTEAISEHIPVVITGTEADRPYIEPIRKKIKNNDNVKWLNEVLSPEHLLSVLAQAKFCVAPSTGVIHLAAALGTPVVGFYSPRRVERDIRWGPLTDKKKIFTPNLNYESLENAMEKIPPLKVFEYIEKELL